MSETISPNSIGKLATAMARAQSQIKVAVFDKKANYGFYASYKSVKEACTQALSDNGIAVFQPVNFDGTNYFLETILVHSSGESISSHVKLIVDRNNMQALGSAITYAKRYAYSAIVGVVSDDDDDGNEASKEPDKETKPKVINQSRYTDEETAANELKRKQDVENFLKVFPQTKPTLQASKMTTANGFKPEDYFEPHQDEMTEQKTILLKDLNALVYAKKLNNDTVKSIIRLHSLNDKWVPSAQLSEKELSAVIDHIRSM